MTLTAMDVRQGKDADKADSVGRDEQRAEGGDDKRGTGTQDEDFHQAGGRDGTNDCNDALGHMKNENLDCMVRW